MSPWRDVVDWVGGYPFEVAKPKKYLTFFHDKGYTLKDKNRRKRLRMQRICV